MLSLLMGVILDVTFHFGGVAGETWFLVVSKQLDLIYINFFFSGIYFDVCIDERCRYRRRTFAAYHRCGKLLYGIERELGGKERRQGEKVLFIYIHLSLIFTPDAVIEYQKHVQTFTTLFLS